jgi:hypothetical protein
MLTIAGGILLAILAISTVGIWLPILMWLWNFMEQGTKRWYSQMIQIIF